MKPIYNHTSFETAYIVDDYPYGFKLRCKRAHWVEYKPSKGFRFVTCTTNPKKGDVWNKPSAGTYVKFAMELYLDDDNHVQASTISEYSKPEEAIKFLNDFPEANLVELKRFIPAKTVWQRHYAAGRIEFTINGVAQKPTESELQERQKSADAWDQALLLLVTRCPEIK